MVAVFSWCKASGFPHIRDKVYNADNMLLVLILDLNGISSFFGKFVQAISEQFKDIKLETEVINNTVVFKIADSLI